MVLTNEDLFKLLKQDVPALKDWPRYTGEGEYNHLEWIRWIYSLQKNMHFPDSLIISKLPMILVGLEKIWFDEECNDSDFSTWEEWKEAIIKHFGTPKWKRSMRNAFDKDEFKEDKHGLKPIKWLVTQKRRLNAAEPSMSVEEIIHKILDKIPGIL